MCENNPLETAPRSHAVSALTALDKSASCLGEDGSHRCLSFLRSRQFNVSQTRHLTGLKSHHNLLHCTGGTFQPVIPLCLHPEDYPGD